MEDNGREKKTQKEFTTYLLLLVGRWVARHLGINEEATPTLKAGAAWELVEEQRMTVESAATLLGVSDRWIYTYLDVARRKDKAPDSPRLRVLDFFAAKHPFACSVGECYTWLERHHFPIHMEKLAELIDALVQVGYLVADGQRYRLKIAPFKVDREQAGVRMKKVVALLHRVVSWLERYVVGRPVFVRELRLELPESAYVELQREIQEFLAAAVGRAVQRAHAQDRQGEKTVKVDGVVIVHAIELQDPDRGDGPL